MSSDLIQLELDASMTGLQFIVSNIVKSAACTAANAPADGIV